MVIFVRYLIFVQYNGILIGELPYLRDKILFYFLTMNNKKTLAQALKEIDKTYSQTIKKLNTLHNKKIELIKLYLLAGDQAGINKIKQSLKNNL